MFFGFSIRLCLFRSPKNVYHSVFCTGNFQVFANLISLFPLEGRASEWIAVFLEAEAVCVVVQPRSTTVRLVKKIHTLPLHLLCDLDSHNFWETVFSSVKWAGEADAISLLEL